MALQAIDQLDVLIITSKIWNFGLNQRVFVIAKAPPPAEAVFVKLQSSYKFKAKALVKHSGDI